MTVVYCTTCPWSNTATTEAYPLSLHDALPISRARNCWRQRVIGNAPKQPWKMAPTPSISAWSGSTPACARTISRSEEHTSELQSHSDLVCRLLLEKKNGKRLGAAGIREQAAGA